MPKEVVDRMRNIKSMLTQANIVTEEDAIRFVHQLAPQNELFSRLAALLDANRMSPSELLQAICANNGIDPSFINEIMA